MIVRYKKDKTEGHSSHFNTHGLSEVVVGGDWGQDSTFIRDLDVFIEGVGWKDMGKAFQDRDIIPDNYNERFGPPIDEECRKRGYNP